MMVDFFWCMYKMFFYGSFILSNLLLFDKLLIFENYCFFVVIVVDLIESIWVLKKLLVFFIVFDDDVFILVVE